MVLDWYKVMLSDQFAFDFDGDVPEVSGKGKKSELVPEARDKQVKGRRLRRGFSEDRLTLDDLVKSLMKEGKRGVADRVMVDCLGELRKQGIVDAEGYLLTRLQMVCPLVEVSSKRRGGRVVQVPFPLRATRSAFLGRKLLVTAASKRKERGMAKRLAAEVLDIQKGRGEALKGRQQLHQQAVRNRSNLSLRW